MKEQNFDSAYKEVKKLVEKFKQGENHYLSPSYSEAAVRQDFLDDFFTALGWDVRHQEQHDPYEQEVKIEQGVKVSGAQKRADYSFSIAPNFRDPKFFAEAKKPAKALKNAQDYFQSIRYGWHKAHPLSILTDFEEFHIIDCRYTPDINNSLDKCYKRFHYTDYLNKEKFAEIYFLFSREAVANNSIEKVAEALPKRKGKAAKFLLHQTIDEAFLEVIDGIREKLAKAFKKQDENLTSEQLTEATQRTVDRLVFIRFLEDKLIEQEHYVSEFGESPPLKETTRSAGDVSAWKDFISVCRKLDAKYNGIVFKEHFIDEQEFAGPEASEFREICQDICHLNSRFLFNEIPIHILGSIYERFLGKVVHATDKRVKVEEKPEVRKAGGVYYTPKYIVDYIVNNTVGKLIENSPSLSGRAGVGLTPEQIAKLRFADIACGSGSFLIGVFDCLLDYHNKYYQKHPDKAKKDGCIEKDGLWVLSIKQKQKILLNNIYGVDIDQQATEVTQLSLALKLLEDETTATANEMQALFHEKILPDMSKNIICGNSLIGNDILTQKKLFSEEEERKLNPMDFEIVFPEVFGSKIVKGTMDIPDEDDLEEEERKPQVNEPMYSYKLTIKGGFDAIVGNPPYVMDLDEVTKKYLNQKYSSSHGKPDLFRFFIERSHLLIKTGGRFGYIVPASLLTIPAASKLRKSLLDSCNYINIVNFWGQVFKDTSVNTIVILTQKGVNDLSIETSFDKSEKPTEQSINEAIKKIISFKKKDWYDNDLCQFQLNTDKRSKKIVEKILKQSISLGSCCKYTLGMQVYHNTIHSKKEIEDRVYHDVKKKNKTFIPESGGKNIGRYYFNETFKKYVSYGEWCYNRPNWKFCSEPRIVIREIPTEHHLLCSYTDSTHVPNKAVIIVIGDSIDNYFLLGILNSTMIGYFVNQTTEKGTQRLFPRISLTTVKNLPIPKINFQNKTEKAAHDKIVALVEQMLQTKKEIKTAKTDKDKTYSERKCSSLDTAIDAEVDKLYDLSEEEIRIVKGK